MAPSPQVLDAIGPYTASMDVSSRKLRKRLEERVQDDERVVVAGMSRWVSRGDGERCEYGYYFVTQRGRICRIRKAAVFRTTRSPVTTLSAATR